MTSAAATTDAVTGQPRKTGRIARFVRGVAVAPIVLYQRLISPAIPRRCKYEPTCSRYAVEAIREFGILRGPVLAAFFKVSCPTCQYAFPFLQRIYEAHGTNAVTIVGISQNTKKDTAAFLREYGITFPVLLDDTGSYPVSNAYGLTNVPTIFWIAGDGEIEISSVGWVKKEMEEFNQRAQTPAAAAQSLFHKGEQVADFRAG